MIHQISINDLIQKEEEQKQVTIPVATYSGERVYTIPEDVWESRCQICIHKNGQDNVQIPAWALYRQQYAGIIPCRIMGISRPNERPGECMSFAPVFGLYGICESCKHNNIFFEGFCTKEGHAPERRVYYGTDYGGDEKKIDYYGRHRLSICDDYEPDQWTKRKEADK